ncbi:Kinetochore protein Ndc80 domain-containing protein [Rozella allomycis CSF55]|uniref:Kinetochore protein NDC80 n=1 Tax=Rozella allomycis (strain CSF55) TaxID=988480 RepID=A0A075AWW8_ROZAC|nr:Kinetochore protein Ndc80 domain-containing protein [Rozella allomycis CSF55]|eukprot:EPZ33202.1 Kinetochore protein Ndc80 domain-containing protein [Rozella allomycis CSF55]
MDRRMTLGVLPDNRQTNFGNFSKPNNTSRLSFIPKPSAAGGMVSSQNSSRLSNFGMANKLSSQLAGLSMSESSRSTLSGRPSQSFKRQSMAPRQSNGRCIMIFRRSSVARGVPSQHQNYLKDPRPTRDRQFILGSIKSLLNFLAETGYDGNINQKLLNCPSTRDAQNIFFYLYQRIDPNYKFEKKFDEEVSAIVRSIRYPFANDINRSQLVNVGSPHSWPIFLAMLTWLVELNLCIEQTNFALNETEERRFYEFLCRAYQEFLNSDGNVNSVVDELRATFSAKDEEIINEINDLSERNKDLQKEYAELTSQPSPLIELQSQEKILHSDIEKFAKLNDHISHKTEKAMEIISRTQNDVESTERELKELEKVKMDLMLQIEAQTISIEDIDRMNADKDHLQKQFENLGQRNQEISQIIWEKEVNIQKKIDTVEKSIHAYTIEGEKIKIIPSYEINASGKDFRLKGTSKESLEIVSIAREHTHHLANNIQEKLFELNDQIIQQQEALDRMIETVTDRQEELFVLEEKIKKFNKKYTEEKNIFTGDSKTHSQELESMEAKIQHMKMESSSSLVSAEQQLQAKVIELDHWTRLITEEKEAIQKELISFTEYSVKANMKSLEDKLEAEIADQ